MFPRLLMRSHFRTYMLLRYWIVVWFTNQTSLVPLNVHFMTIRFALVLGCAICSLYVYRVSIRSKNQPWRFLFLTIMQMYHFTVHGFIRSKSQPSQWILTEYTFGHEDLHTCQLWVNQLNELLKLEVGRPRNLLVCSVIGQAPAL